MEEDVIEKSCGGNALVERWMEMRVNLKWWSHTSGRLPWLEPSPLQSPSPALKLRALIYVPHVFSSRLPVKWNKKKPREWARVRIFSWKKMNSMRTSSSALLAGECWLLFSTWTFFAVAPRARRCRSGECSRLDNSESAFRCTAAGIAKTPIYLPPVDEFTGKERERALKPWAEFFAQQQTTSLLLLLLRTSNFTFATPLANFKTSICIVSTCSI